jgi:DNA-binding SARP family transcriptional activator/LysM repeat protein
MPRVRGLGLAQPLARLIATGLLVVVPMVGSNQAAARAGPALLVHGRVAAATPVVERNTPAPGIGAPIAGERRDAGVYVVQPGDSVYSIAERMAGPEPGAIIDFAQRVLDLNLGEQMLDGRFFTNAALIDVGWELRLPDGETPDPVVDAAPARLHVVEDGESLWSIADDELDDPARWIDIYEANRGRTFGDGRALHDPDVIQPGWELALPDGDDAEAETGGVSDDVAEPDVRPARVESDSDMVGYLEIDTDEPVSSLPDESDESDESDEAATGVSRPTNVWVDPVDDALIWPTPASSVAPPDMSPSPSSSPEIDDVQLMTYRRAAMLSAGVLTLLAVRRRAQMRQVRPGSRLLDPSPEMVATERTLRAIDPGERYARVDVAIRHVALSLADAGARVQAVAVDHDGGVELFVSRPVSLEPPWEGLAERARWRLPAGVPIEMLAERARRVGAPCPTLVQIGRDLDERDIYLDLEALEAIEVGGSAEHADAIVAAVGMTLATSVLAEVTTLVGVCVPDEVFLGHRHHRSAASSAEGFDLSAEAVGSIAHAERTTFDLRARVTSGEMWEPTVVLVGSRAGAAVLPPNRAGLAVVSASPIHGPSSRLAPDGDAWTLLPLGIRLVPIGLDSGDVASVAALADLATTTEIPAAAEPDPDDTVLGPVREVGDVDEQQPAQPSARRTVLPDHELVVRLLGRVSVESARDGRPVEFERSKTTELIAWLATHRERATRSNARAALWELDVRDATFHNVVSEARRALARCVAPPEGEEWVARAMGDDLRLHELVVTDADLVEHALTAARVQPPDQALVTLGPALDWVVGTPFEGTSYLWADAEGVASSLVMTAITLCDAYARHALSVGDIDGVFDASGRGLQVLPAHEDMIAVRMEAYAQAGDRVGVRHEWESYERAVTVDPWSDGEPSDRMLELRRTLLSNRET